MKLKMRCNIFRRGAGAGAGGTGSLVVPSQAASYMTGMGKGLREPCSPFREAYVFGAELGAPNANNWNCVAEIVDPTASFDLSAIEANHEVVVALVALYNLPAGKSYLVTYRWYRNRDNKLLFEIPYQIPDPGTYGYASWSWYYVYSYIGYVPWEIYENGSYHVDIWLDQSLLERIGFTVSGIPQLATGSVGLGLIYYDGIPSGGWENLISGCQVPTGVPIYLAPQWVNNSNVNIVGHIDLVMDGTALTATQNQDQQAAPGNGWYVQFSPVTLSVGTHTFTATLSSGGQILDTKTFTLISGILEPQITQFTIVDYVKG